MSPSTRARVLDATLPALTALGCAALLGSLVILAFGQAPAVVYALLFEGTWGQSYGLGQVLYKATTLTCTGLSVAFALRAGLFNVGAEGQLAAGAFAAALLGVALPESASSWWAVPACVLAAAVGGALVGALPGYLKARFGAHEVIVTILLNFIVLAALNYVVSEKLHVHETVHTPPVVAGATLARFDAAFPGSALNASVFLAAALVAVTAWTLFRSRFGYDVRATGYSPGAAQYGGVRVAGVYVGAMALSGALAGLGGVNFVLGYKHYYEDGFTGGAGFFGIAVAIVGRSHPLGVVLAAVLFATLSQGGLAIHALVPKQMVEVLEAVVILAMAAAVPATRALLARRVTPPMEVR